MKPVVPLAALVLLSTISGAAHAASPIDADARCLAIGDRIAQGADPKAKESGKLMQVFFLGRIDAAGRPSPAILSTALVDAARRLNGEFAKGEAARCSGVIKAAIGGLETAGPMANKALQVEKPAAGR